MFDGRKMQVLLVEDDATALETMLMRFEREGLDVDAFADGYDAIDALRMVEYDAIVLDLIITSGLNGFGVLNYIELEKPELLDRIFLVSGMSEQTIMNTAPALMPRFFRKPFDDRKLVEAVKALAMPARPPAVEGPRVLIADDDRASRSLIGQLIGRGVNVETVANGHEAIARLAAEPYEALILDIVMPELDGFAVLGYLEQMKPEMLARTIVTTGLPANYRRGGHIEKVFALIEKPCDGGRLRELVAEVIANEKAPSAVPGAS